MSEKKSIELKNELSRITLKMEDGAPEVQFTGYLIARVNEDNGSGTDTILSLFYHSDGSLVVYQCQHYYYEDTYFNTEHKKCQTEKQVIEYLKYSALAKKLYEEANINYEEEI